MCASPINRYYYVGVYASTSLRAQVRNATAWPISRLALTSCGGILTPLLPSCHALGAPSTAAVPGGCRGRRPTKHVCGLHEPVRISMSLAPVRESMIASVGCRTLRRPSSSSQLRRLALSIAQRSTQVTVAVWLNPIGLPPLQRRYWVSALEWQAKAHVADGLGSFRRSVSWPRVAGATISLGLRH